MCIAVGCSCRKRLASDVSGISSSVSERLISLAASFSRRTSRFKERTIQPPTPSSSPDLSSSSPTAGKRHRLVSLVPVMSRASDAESVADAMFVEVKGRKVQIPKCIRRLSPTRTIDPTSKYAFIAGMQVNSSRHHVLVALDFDIDSLKLQTFGYADCIISTVQAKSTCCG